MKVISIGRSPENMIIIDDMMVSRRHAMIRISSSGKYELISTGTNGTKVNGNQVAPNVPYPLKRGDSVIFANAAPLDWNRIPDPMRPYKLAAIGVCIAVVVALLIVGVVKFVNNYTGSDDEYIANPEQVEQTDSVKKSEGDSKTDSVKTNGDSDKIKNLFKTSGEYKKQPKEDLKPQKPKIDPDPQTPKNTETEEDGETGWRR